MSIVNSNYGWTFDTSDKMLFYDGTDWTERNFANGDTYIFSSHFLSENLGWVAGSFGKIYKYENGNWILENGNTIDSFWSIYVVDPTHGWTGHQSIFRYNGSEWLEEFDNDGLITSVFFTDIHHGWAIAMTGYPTDQSYIYKYNGENWYLEHVVPEVYMHGIFFTEPTNGWAVGELGTILKYNGLDWVQQPSITYERLEDVFFLDQNHGWICGNYGTILYYDGSEWIIQNSGTYSNLVDIHFTDSLTGWAVGERTILYTNTGGNIITGIDDYPDIDASTQFLVYPNPSRDFINLSFDLQSFSMVSLKLYSLSGQVIIDRPVEYTSAGNNELKFDIRSLSKGIYICSLKTGDGETTKKIVKH